MFSFFKWLYFDINITVFPKLIQFSVHIQWNRDSWMSLKNCQSITAVTQVQCSQACCVFWGYHSRFPLLGCKPASLGEWLRKHRSNVLPWLTMEVNQEKLLFTSVPFIIEISRALCSSGIGWKCSLINDVFCIWSGLLPLSLLCHGSKTRVCFEERSWTLIARKR